MAEGVGSEELGGVLTRAAQSNITAVGTTSALISRRWEIPSVFSNLLPVSPSPYPLSRYASYALFAPTLFSKEKHPIARISRAVARSNILLPPEEI